MAAIIEKIQTRILKFEVISREFFAGTAQQGLMTTVRSMGTKERPVKLA